jgi:hypothetical protein
MTEYPASYEANPKYPASSIPHWLWDCRPVAPIDDPEEIFRWITGNNK